MPKFELNRALSGISERYTPAMREDDDLRNKDLRSRIDPNSARNRIGRATAQMNVVLDQIDFLKTQPESELKTIRMRNALDRLGELFAEQGRYSDAVKVTEDPKRRASYETLQQAVDIDDNTVCECTDDRAVSKNADVTLPVRIEAGQVVRDGRLASLQVCIKCGFANAR